MEIRNLSDIPVTDLFFCICDHFEPYWNQATPAVARRRIERWVREYPKCAEKYKDHDGRSLKYSFFYPEEEYRRDDMEELASLCRAGFGEVEIHLHHDNDTSENLRKTLVEYKNCLYEDHGLLSVRDDTGEISYGFIHGNWALDNSRPDGRWCGVNDEIDILRDTGCYADFTMPSAPSDTQTRKVNSIYYALDDPKRPKSHDKGIDARMGVGGKGLLLVQGPLGFDWCRRKFGILPRIENGGLGDNNRPSIDRISIWIDERIHIIDCPTWAFVKIYTHGAQEHMMKMLFDNGGFHSLFSGLDAVALKRNIHLHYVSAREMVNVICALESGLSRYTHAIRDSKYLNNKAATKSI
jgi:hypothetical protein